MAKSTAAKAATVSEKSSAKPTAGKASSSKGAESKNKSVLNISSDSPEIGLLEKFFIDGLKDIYWAEKALTKALPKMQKAATTDQLKSAFADHLTVTQTQVGRLEQIFEAMGKKAQAKKCEAMEGLLKESEGMIEETEKGSMTRDVALIMASQKVEHYEIATYGGLAQLAKTLGHDDAKELLGQSLQEEKDADILLTEIAEGSINEEAEKED